MGTEVVTKIAKFISEKVSGVRANMHLYKMTPALDGHQFVVVSAVNAMFSGPETLIFPSDESGEITDWGELEGSFRGSLDHSEALEDVGYEVETS